MHTYVCDNFYHNIHKGKSEKKNNELKLIIPKNA